MGEEMSDGSLSDAPPLVILVAEDPARPISRSSNNKKKKKKKKKSNKSSSTKRSKIVVAEEDADEKLSMSDDDVGASIVIVDYSAPQPPQRGLVLVTGCGGYIGAHTCKALIEAGYRVRGTVRTLEDTSAYQHLLNDGHIRFPVRDVRLLDPSSSTLEFVQADLLDDVSVWETAMKGCDAVVHIAGPSIHPRDVTDARKQLFVPIVAGTSRVVQAAINTNTIKRFIFTSSIYALSHTFKETFRPGFKAFTERDWNMDSDMKSNAFGFCKTIAERATQSSIQAHNEAATSNDDKISYASVLPAYVVGAPLSGRSTASVDFIVVSAMTGVAPIDIELGMVAVKDVATAYVRLLDNPDAEGRFILWAESQRLPMVADGVKLQLGSDHQMVAAAIEKTVAKPLWRQKLEQYAPLGLVNSFERSRGDQAFMKELIQLDGVRFDVTRANDVLDIYFSSVRNANVESALWATRHSKLTT